MPAYKRRIRNEDQRTDVLHAIRRAPIGERGFQVECKRWTRTDEQNRLMWVLLGKFSAQAELHGKKWPAHAWKSIFMNALGHSADMLPTLDGEAFFSEGHRSSKLTIDQMTALIEFIYQQASERGVKLEMEHAA